MSLETGEEVVAVSPPARASALTKQRWKKFRPVSVDPASATPEHLLDVHETAHHDFVSVHIKVHGLDSQLPTTWTRKFKEYLEMMAPGKDYPFHLLRRDDRGERATPASF